MSDQEQFTSGTTESDAEQGKGDAGSEHRQLDDPPVRDDAEPPAADEDRNP